MDVTGNICMLLIWSVLDDEKFSVPFLEKRVLLQTCCSFVTADCISSEECSTVFRLNCKFAQAKCAV